MKKLEKKLINWATSHKEVAILFLLGNKDLVLKNNFSLPSVLERSISQLLCFICSVFWLDAQVQTKCLGLTQLHFCEFLSKGAKY